MVLYFTGTGNSKYIAEKIASSLGEPIYSINSAIKSEDYELVFTGIKVIVVTPTYAWRIPRLVQDWLEKVELPLAEKIWFVMDCGSEIGNADKYNRELAVKKNLTYMGTAQIVMPENYIALFRAPSEEKSKIIINNAQRNIEKIIKTIAQDKFFITHHVSVVDRIKSGPVNKLFYPVYVKADKFSVKDTCIGCHECVHICPLNNIHIETDKPIWGKNCTHCMACISHCPKEAIEYGKHTVGLRRYHL